MSAGALDGLRVVELASGVAAPFASRMLADLGADVVKVEDLHGDPLRGEGPFLPDDSEHTNGGLFGYVNANKRGIVLGSDEIERLRTLIAGADILVENFGPGGLESRGLATELLRKGNAGLVVARLSDFGQTGPDAEVPATPLTLQARAGWVAARGPESVPMQVGGTYLDFIAGTYLAAAMLTAYEVSRTTGLGGDVDVSMLECAHSTTSFPVLTNGVLARMGRGPHSAGHVLLGVKRCADGWVGINVLTGQQWRDVCLLVGAEEYADRQDELRTGGPDRADFEARVDVWLADQRAEDVVELCQAMRIPAVPVHDGASIAGCAQWTEREFFTRAAARNGEFLHPSFPWRLSGSPAEWRRPAPHLGEHTEEVMAHRWAPRTMVGLESDADPERPLAGLRVLDLGTFWAGGACGSYLGAMGADVIKIESIQRPDGFRFNMTGPKLGAHWYEFGRFRAVNLNKRGLTLDLSRGEGRELLTRLLDSADVVLENYSARVIEVLGFDWDTVRSINPEIVMIRMPGYGLEGPWRDYVGWGNAFEQVSGQSFVSGSLDGKPQTPGGYTDPLVAMHGVVATLGALRHRRNGGGGQLVEVCQIEVGVTACPDPVIEYSMTGEVRQRTGNRSSKAAPQGVYRTADGWIALSVRDDADWVAVGEALGNPEWIRNPALAGAADRASEHDRIDELMSGTTAQHGVDDLVKRLSRSGVPASKVAGGGDYLNDPQLQHRRYYETLDHPDAGSDRYQGWPVRFSVGPDRSHRSSTPTLGQHNREILAGELGLGDDELAALEKAGIIGTVPTGLGAPAPAVTEK
ncbi:CoA transferase [Rhodococcus oxybenzonivorans]|uniref:CaiB/BaiF CoA transferase family protein n=1 Tax=Rhodococcus oxybenzonivorans TaxID=1990687 RepID=UPI0029534132|nr:CoA transferase [Rhodococcus oxybenzonivorans]MDV7352715.1 CoA transferase [Rhodococcus oxybenzonivorans]